MRNFLPILLAFLVAGPAVAAPVRAPHIEAELVAEHTAWLPGADNAVALRLKPDPGWHTYWRNPGDSGLPTSLIWSLPEGWSADEIRWPYPEPHRLGELVNYGYGEDTLHLVTLRVPKIPEGGERTVTAEARWLVCSDICIPGSAELSLTLPVSAIATVDPVWAPRFRDARARLPAPEPLPGAFEIADGELRVAIEAGEKRLARATRARFYPYLNDLVNHGALQRSALEPAVVRFAQPLSSFYTGVPDPVEGVLVVYGPVTQAYSVSAAAGAVATVDMPVLAAEETAADAPTVAQPALLLVLGFALLGGLILNLMPCVFPVLSIKAVSMLEAHARDAAGRSLHALMYAAGVVLSCAALAGVLIALRAAGGAVGWGFQLQSPLFVGVLAYLLFALGLSLSGVVQFGTRFMGVGQSLTERGGYAGSFYTGVLATVVATPCTAPFMGAALGYALVQPAPVALLVFVTLGIGLALPFLLLGLFPGVARVLPKPGAWMETFKQAMAFPLYLTVVWLVWVLGRQTGIDALALVLLGLTLVAFALWLWGAAERSLVRGSLAVLVGVGALAVLAHPAMRAAPPAAEAPEGESLSAQRGVYSDRMLQTLRAEGRAVFVNFTADWCITCKVNEKVVLDNDRVLEAFARKNVVWLTADWTRPDPEITDALARFGRSGVPLYLLYPPGGEAVVLPQILTPELVIEAVNRLP